MLGEGLARAGIGIGAGIVYTPGAGHKEIFELVKAVGRYGVALFVHIRGGTKQPGSKISVAPPQPRLLCV